MMNLSDRLKQDLMVYKNGATREDHAPGKAMEKNLPYIIRIL